MRFIAPTVGLHGRFKFENVCPHTGRRTLLADWFDNMILNNGRDEFWSRAVWNGYCQVGTDDTLPNILQDSLAGHTAGTNNILHAETVKGNIGSAPFYGFKRTVYRFVPGEIVGGAALDEVGIGWGSSGTTLATRGLIVDSDGNRTSPTPDVTEFLDVTHELQYIVPTASQNGTVTIDGIGYTWEMKAAHAGSGAWSDYIGQRMGVIGNAASEWTAYDGNMGLGIENYPTGNSAAMDSDNFWNNTYNPGTFTGTMGAGCGPTGWNIGSPPATGGIQSMLIYTQCGVYQIQFEADGTGGSTPGDPIPKIDSKTANMTVAIAFADGTAL